MKLQKLTIHNIASIEDAIIDFEKEPLAGSDVFLITGETGSGKSTILDAICLALYADTPRLDNSKMQGKIKIGEEKTMAVDDPRNLLRRNTGYGFAELAFTDSKGVHYEARWEVQRARKKADGAIQPKAWTLTNIDTGHKYVGDKEVVPVIAESVGLSFDQFCRTTMLAQGEFTRFLNSSDPDKAGILEKITDIDIYKRISKKIYEITSQKNNLLEIAKGGVGQISLPSDSDIAQKKTDISTCDAQYNALKLSRDNANTKFLWIKKEAELNGAVASAEQKFKEAEQALLSDHFKAADTQLTQWNATIDARTWLKALRGAEAEQAQQQKHLNSLQASFLQVLAGRAFEEQRLQALAAQLASLPQVDENEAGKMQKELSALRDQRDKLVKLKSNIQSAEERIADLVEKKQLRLQAAKNLEKSLADIAEKDKAAKDLSQPIAEALNEKNDRLAAFNTQKEVNDVLIQLIRQKVHPGDPCPVCGQTISSPLPREEQLAKLIIDSQQAFAKAEQAYNDLVGKQNQLLADKKAFETSYNKAKAEYDSDTSLALSSQRVLQACADCGITSFDEDATPRQLLTLKEKADADFELLKAQIPSLEAKVNAYIATTQERTRLSAQQASLTNTLDSVRLAVDAIQKMMPEWAPLTPAAPVELPSLLEKTNALGSSVHTAVTRRSVAATAAADNQALLKDFLLEHPEFSLEHLAALNAVNPADIATLTATLTAAREAKSLQEGALRQAKDSLSEHLKAKPQLGADDTPEQLSSFIVAKDREMAEINSRKGALQQELEAYAENQRLYGERVKAKERAEADYNRWHRLCEFLGSANGDKFNRIAQSYILGSLIHSANHYMQNLYDRYTLKVLPGTFVIMIEDAYQGYASRVVSTISGGESFLVSLALALALSDIGDRLAVDTLFIDEGFGTLSGTPLQHAISTLRKLHTQSGRHVGIISHVEELKDSITTQIQVHQSPGTNTSHIQIIPQ